jgi:arylsulfatase I/J
MVNYLDDNVGNVTAALKAKGMWDNLLWVSSADNGKSTGPCSHKSQQTWLGAGGPIYNNGTAGANNYPLRGGKMSNWEGGIRANAYVSGGFLPPGQRGTKNANFTAIEDW